MKDTQETASDRELNAVNLKNELWDTLHRVRSGDMTPAAGDVVASQAREILRTTNVQLRILHAAREQVTSELIRFAAPQKR